MECYCCGHDRDAATVAALRCHDEITVCRSCAEWLIRRSGGVDVTPTLPVADIGAAARFYENAGFDVRRWEGGGFAFVSLNNQSVFDLDLHEDMSADTNHAGCYIVADDVDAWHARLSAAGVHVSPVEDMPWEMHEFDMTDPDGNRIRIGQPVSDEH